MKKWIIWTIALTAVALLIIRQFNKLRSGAESQGGSYISKLNFDFSARVDSIDRRGHVILHVTHGYLNRQKEKRLNDELKVGSLELFLYLPDNKLDMLVDSAAKYQPGDSVYINSSNNSAKIYRRQQLLSNLALAKFLRYRPF